MLHGVDEFDQSKQVRISDICYPPEHGVTGGKESRKKAKHTSVNKSVRKEYSKSQEFRKMNRSKKDAFVSTCVGEFQLKPINVK